MATHLLAALRVIAFPGGTLGKVLLGEHVYVPLSALVNVSIDSLPIEINVSENYHLYYCLLPCVLSCISP